MAYEMKREDAIRAIETLGFTPYKIKGDEITPQKCPYCGGGSGDDGTFSINLKTGAFHCFRSSCNKSGHFVEFCRDFGFDLEFDVPRVYKRLKQPDEAIKPKDEAIEYLASRGISRPIVERYEITVRSDAPGVLVFPFYDDRGKLVFIKYRNTKATKKNGLAKETSEADTMPILFGMKQATDYTKPLVITEGQIDSLSLAEAGVPNPVSVPTGQSGFTWFPYCREWMMRFPEVIVFGDHENGKVTLYDALKARLKMPVRVVRGIDYLGEKDANDILRAYGKEALTRAVSEAVTPLTNWVKDLSTVPSLDLSKMERINTGMREIDRALRGMVVGQVILLTGKRGQGKSTFMSQVVANALDQNESVFVYSGELSNANFRLWLDYQLAGGKHIIERKSEYGKEFIIDPETEAKIGNWYKGRAWIYDNDYIPDEEDEMKAVTDIIEGIVQQYSVRLVCVDNLMTAMDTVNSQDNLYLAQSNFVGKLKKIAMKYGIVIILVAHPRKSVGDFNNDDVSGSSDITNKVDIVMNYSRGNDPSEGRVEITKNRLFGTLRHGEADAIRLRYSENTKRIFDDDGSPARVYGWERKGSVNWMDNAMEVDEDLPF